MATMETLRQQGFHFFCFHTEERRENFILKKLTEEYACVNVDEVIPMGKNKFSLYYLAVRKLHHVPVVYTPSLEG